MVWLAAGSLAVLGQSNRDEREVIMATLVQVVGYGWAIIGFGNLIGMFSKVHDPTWQTAGFLFNVILFILPGQDE